MPTTTVRLTNRSAHIVTLLQTKGATVDVPPPGAVAELGQVESGVVELVLDDGERAALDKSIATPAVQAWIAAGELAFEDITPEPPPLSAATGPSTAGKAQRELSKPHRSA